MARTYISTQELKNDNVTREDLNITSTGNAVITKVLTSTGLTQVQTGIDIGTGDVTIGLAATSKDLLDTPSSFVGHDDKILIIDEDANQLIFDKIKNINIDDLANIDWDKINLAGSVLSDIDDIDISTIENNKILVWSSTGNEWVTDYITNNNINSSANIDWTKINKTGSSLNDLDNVDIDSVTDSNFLMYSSTGAKWVPAAAMKYTGLTYEDRFSATQGQTEFTLSITPVSKMETIVSLNGMIIATDEYELVGRTITLAYGIDATTKVTIKYGSYGSLSNNFIDMDDTPVNYSGQGNKIVSVNSLETGLEFTDSTNVTKSFLVSSGNTTSTGYFVEYSNGLSTFTDTNTTAFSLSPYVFKSSGSYFSSIVALSDSMAIVAYSDNGNSNYGTASILSISGQNIITGPSFVFESAAITNISITALSNSKAIVAYSDGGNSNYGTACILSISGLTITAGTPVVFESADTKYISITALADTKAIVAYSDYGNSNYGTSCVLSIDGTTITAGTPIIFESASVQYTTITALSTSKAIVAYADSGNSHYGTACALSISGLTITAGTPIIFENSYISYVSITALSDTKVIVAYLDNNASKGTACVLSISGTTVTAGTSSVVINSNSAEINITTLSDSKAIIAYKDLSNSYYGTICVLSVSETTITSGNLSVFESAYTSEPSIVALSDSMAIVAYTDEGNSNYGTACTIIINNKNTDTIIGIATESKSSGESCIISFTNTMSYTCVAGYPLFVGSSGKVLQTNFPFLDIIPRLPKPTSKRIGVGLPNNEIILFL